jgi:riboflavin transporter FmnP
MVNSKVKRLAEMALLSAISLILLVLIRIPIIPTATFLVFDIADVPIIIGSMIFGAGPGVFILLVVSLLQAFVFSGDGIIGFVMHFFSSGVMIFVLAFIYKKGGKTFKAALWGMVAATISMTAAMIPLNYIITVNFYGIPIDIMNSLIFPAIIPFNLIKGGANCIIAGIIFRLLHPIIKKYI